MSVFVDTSAILALLDADDRSHAHAVRAWSRALGEGEDVVTTNYVVVETHAVVQRRFGLEAVRRVVEDLMPALRVRWVDPEVHARAVGALLTARRRELSLVDCVSFAVMHDEGIRRALVYDPDFEEQGFEPYGPA